MKYTGPKARLCRREQIDLFGSKKYQKILNKRQGIPGMHGAKRQQKMTEFGKQLREKQKVKRMFGLSEKQFAKYFVMASKQSGITGGKMMELLERRLDNVIYRAGFALTRMQARQFAGHGLFLLNGRRVDCPSVKLKIGDKIELRQKNKGTKLFTEIFEELADVAVPSWLQVDRKKMIIEVISLPIEEHFEQSVNSQIIVEFYSR